MQWGEPGAEGAAGPGASGPRQRWRQTDSLCRVRGQLGLWATVQWSEPDSGSGGAHSLGDRTDKSQWKARPGRGSGTQASNTGISIKSTWMILHPGPSRENSCLPWWLPVTAETNPTGHEHPSSSVTFHLVPSALKLRERRKQGQTLSCSTHPSPVAIGVRVGGQAGVVVGCGSAGCVFSGLSVSSNDRERER